MKLRHAILRIILLLAVNLGLIALYFHFPDPKLHGWLLTALGGIFAAGDAALAIVLKGFDEIEADASLDARSFRRLRLALLSRRQILRPMLVTGIALRIVTIASGLLLLNYPNANAHNFLIIVGYVCTSFGIMSFGTLMLNVFDVSSFKSDQRATARAEAAAAEQRAKIAKG